VDDRPAPLALKDRTKDWSRPLEPLPARKRDIGTTADERRPYVRLIRAPETGADHTGLRLRIWNKRRKRRHESSWPNHPHV